MSHDDKESFALEKKAYETEDQFEFRKEIYDEVYNETHDFKKALIYSNIWVNILSLDSEYPKEIMDQIQKYKPRKNIYALIK